MPGHPPGAPAVPHSLRAPAMQLVIEHRGQRHEVDLQVDDPSARVADLVALFDPLPGTSLTVDGRSVDAQALLAGVGLFEGGTVAIGPTAPMPAPTMPNTVVVV